MVSRSGVPQTDVQMPSWTFVPGLIKTAAATPAAVRSPIRAGIGRPLRRAILPATSCPANTLPSPELKRALELAACAASMATAGAAIPASPVGTAKPGVVPRRVRAVPSVSETVTVAPRGRLMKQRG
jgi:hypothetical protein